jgi:hypothetical protein
MAIPIRLLWNLQISVKEKVGLCFVFAVGIITMVFAIVRAISLNSLNVGGQVDTTWLILWAAIEGAVGMCTPYLLPRSTFQEHTIIQSAG